MSRSNRGLSDMQIEGLQEVCSKWRKLEKRKMTPGTRAKRVDVISGFGGTHAECGIPG